MSDTKAFDPKEIDRIMRMAPVIPVLVVDDIGHARETAAALVEGGLKVLEVTLRTSHAIEAIKRMNLVPGAVVGAGTVTNPDQLHAAIDAGSEFIVSPGLTQRPYGAWEGLTWADVQARWPEEFEARRRGEDPDIPGWGASAEVAVRVGAALRERWDPDRVTVVVSHGSAIQLGLLDVLGLEPLSRTFGSVPHAAWHEIRRVDSGAWHVDAFGLGAD